MRTFNLSKDFNENGIFIKKGNYTYDALVRIFGDEGKFNFCFTCTSLKEILKEIIETPEDNLNTETPKQTEEVELQENKEIETPEDNLNIEAKIPKIKKKSGK